LLTGVVVVASGLILAQLGENMQDEMRNASLTWAYYKYGGTVHAFTLLEDPVWNGDKSVVSL
jgi:hypothetical protein